MMARSIATISASFRSREGKSLEGQHWNNRNLPSIRF